MMRRQRLYGLFLVLSVCGPQTLSAAPSQWRIVDGGNGHSYEGVGEPNGISWTEAKAAAESRGGYLATIHSQAENDFVFNLISGYEFWHGPTKPGDAFTGPWLGGYQPAGSLEPDGGWTWVTGEPWTFTNWHPSFGGTPLPDNSGNADKLHFIQEFSSIIQPTSYWDDLADIPSGVDYGVVAYVVEYVPEPAAWILSLVGLSFVVRRRAA
jgi:hypothetical protein